MTFTDNQLKQAAFVKARVPIPNMEDCHELLWFRVMEVLPALKKVTGRLYKKSSWQPDMTVGTKMNLGYDQIIDVRERTTIGIEEMMRTLD